MASITRFLLVTNPVTSPPRFGPKLPSSRNKVIPLLGLISSSFAFRMTDYSLQ